MKSSLRFLMLCAGLLTACASAPRSDLESERAEALLRAPAATGYISDAERESVSWQGNGELLLTPAALYITHPGGYRAISYATITAVTVRSVREWRPLGEDRIWGQVLVVESSRSTCGRGCAFRFNAPGMAAQFAHLVEAHREGVDPFGRRDDGREAWLAAGLRNARSFWGVDPVYLESTDPAGRKAVEDWFCLRTGCKAGGSTAAIYGSAMQHVLARDPVAGYVFHELPGIEVNFRSELSTRALAKALESADEGIHRLLVSDLDRIELAEKISPDYVVSIEAKFRAYVDYFDLRPLKDGKYFYAYHTVTLPLDQWLSLDDAAFRAAVSALAQEVARLVGADLSRRQGNEQEGPGNSSGIRPPTAHAVLWRIK